MNKYICKAKRVDNGEWVFGFIVMAKKSIDYMRYKNSCVMISDLTQLENGRLNGMMMIEVDPKTVCRNNGKYFEGDYFIDNDYDDAYCIISYDEELSIWQVGICGERVIVMNVNTPVEFYEPLNDWNSEELNILGNIHDSEVTNE